MSAAAGSVNRSSEYRPGDDHYPTPREAVYPLVRAVPLPQRIWEPACGEGHICEVLAEYGHFVFGSNLQDRGYGRTNVDFLKVDKAWESCIVTNPPYSLANEFVLHAIDLRVDVACFLLRTKFLEGADRYREIHGRFPPFAVLQFIERIKFFAGDTAQADQPGWNTEAFAWFIWRKGFRGRPTVGWLSRDDGMTEDFFGGRT